MSTSNLARKELRKTERQFNPVQATNDIKRVLKELEQDREVVVKMHHQMKKRRQILRKYFRAYEPGLVPTSELSSTLSSLDAIIKILKYRISDEWPSGDTGQ